MKPSLVRVFFLFAIVSMMSATAPAAGVESGSMETPESSPMPMTNDAMPSAPEGFHVQELEPIQIRPALSADDETPDHEAADDETPDQEDAVDIFALVGEGYPVQPGDVLTINVWKEQELQGQATVLPDGTISFPLIGYMDVAGKTLPAIRDGVQERLAKFIPDPEVTVSMAQLSGNQIYVIGNVTRPGAFTANRNLDVMQLLSIAGGMTTFAAVKKIKIIRRVDDTQQVIPFNYRDLEKGIKLEQNILLIGGDVVVVP